MLKFFAIVLTAGVLVASGEETVADKRSFHPDGDYWRIHCWDHAPNHLMDPFCALLEQKCDDPPTVENGKTSEYTNTSVGSRVNYTCDDGYVMSGEEVIICERLDITELPKWSKPPTCNKVTCPAIPDLENGFHEAKNTTELGTTVRYFCNERFAMEGNDTITCELVGPGNNANWTQPLPSCKEIICPKPSINNGQVVLPNPLYIAFTVPPTTTSVIRTTTEPPTTTTEVFTTTTVTSMPDNSTDVFNDTATEFPLTGVNTNLSETFDNVSDSKINTDNDTNLTDTSNDITTVVPDVSIETSTEKPDSAIDTNTVTFTALPEITTEILTITTNAEPSTISPYIPITNETFQINDTVIYRCNPGYGFASTENARTVKYSLEATCVVLIDKNNRTTTWSSSVDCVPECEPVPTVENANHTEPTNTLQGAEVIYSCDDSFEMIGPSKVTCLATGNWSERPYCRGCLNPPEVEHATHDAQYNTTINSTVSYLCIDGYSMLGTELITCVPSSQSPYAEWTKTPICLGGCGTVPSIENGEHTIPDNFLTGSNVTYSCFNGSKMSGSPDVVCLASGNWSQTPTCSAVCTDLPDIPNSDLTQYDYDKVIVTCKEQYILTGNDTLECIDGNWSTPYPVCECQIKPIDIVFIIDGSGSLGLHGFRQTLAFVVDMVQRFPEETTNFGLLAFSSSVYRQFYLNQYVNNTAGMIDRIQNTTYPTGGTYTYSALAYAREQMFQEKNGMRPNVTHTAIIVTDGQSNDFNETVHQAELLKAEGVTIYSVGVGLTNKDELNLIASKPSYVFTVDNYDLIDQIAGPLAGITCTSTLGNSEAEVGVQ